MNRAESVAPAEAAAEAVKAYLRMHRSRIAEDPELLALLLPERFQDLTNVSDYQRFVIDRLVTENSRLKNERDGLRRVSDRAGLIREGVRRLVLDLIDARDIAQSISVATGAAQALYVDLVSLGIENGAPPEFGREGMFVLAQGLTDTLVERDAAGALMKGGAQATLFPGAERLQSVAVFRLRMGPKAAPALYVVGSREADRFDDDGETREIAYFVRALERTMGVWLQPPIP